MSDGASSPLRVVDEGLWSADGTVAFLGQALPARTTIVRLASGDLLAYSPIALTPELKESLAALGSVTDIIAPSRYHHLSFGDWVRTYPEARTYGAPGLSAKRPELPIAAELDDAPPSAWRGELDQLVFRGLPVFNEVIMYHRATRTLVLCDLVFNIHRASGWFAQLIMRMNGMWRHFGPSRAVKMALMRNRDVSLAALEAMFSWDFERVVPAHGEILEAGGQDAMRRAFQFLSQAPGEQHHGH